MIKEDIDEYGCLWLSLMTTLMTKVKLMMARDDKAQWTLDVGTGTPNEPNDPYCGHLKMT